MTLTFLVLNLGFHIVDRVGRLDLQSDGLASESLDENLHASTQAQNKMKSRLLLDVVVGKRSPVLELLAGKN
jgi:hypothetical protein